MSQSRTRKAPVVGGDAGPRARVSLTKASGDTSTPHPQQHPNQRSKSNKVPKALRYDLENALVGLCDVWFEDIKPHLVRNNIKVHVHGAGAGDNQQQIPSQAPGCSHLDPGAASDRQRRLAVNSAGCYSTQRTALKVQCRKPRAPRCPPASQQSSTLRQRPMQPYPNREGKPPTKARVRQAASPSSSPPKSEFNGLVPRLCHTYSIPSSITLIKRNSKSLTRPKNCKKKKLKENKSTQTQRIPQCPQSITPQKMTNSPKKFHKSRATTAFYPSRRIRSRNGHLRTNNCCQLFHDDVIEIIGERHDKFVKTLYQSEKKEDYPSVMNLVRTPKGRRKQVAPKKCKPWR